MTSPASTQTYQITVEVVNNNGTIMPKVDSVGFTRILTAGINAFTNAIKA